MTDPLRGAHTLAVTPFDTNGELDEASLRSLVEYLIEGGVHGVIGLGTTGEFFTLSMAERLHIMSTMATAVRGRVSLTFGVGDSATANAVALAKRAEELGAAAVMVPPPYYFGHSNAAVTHHILEIASAIRTPVMVYDGGGGREVSVATLARMRSEASNVSMVKLSLPNPSKVSAVLADAPGIAPICGDDTMLMLALAYGAAASSIGIGNLVPAAVAGLHNAYDSGDLVKARRLHRDALLPLVAVCGSGKSEYIRCFKEVLVKSGVIDFPTTRPPLLPLDPVRREELMAVARDTGVF
ncbi:dihydrodipicolinate synthase family protein [Rhodococcus sp. T7]|uniref:dihydrodipicolinate synthase family protein n=1 Tax=Rhodococcus sp. T7 TaxID=627444 RepID=UPI0013580061|nr:dihydrodipicolinate synthase family protein [Rhodococcus sp. T7]KAF0957328.1 4-hydroxy-tetrahydrodipicolinate synthase [Rhodococcus sp. T7]KAF0959179.1 4-hydroxy-tetrahydrodipicolinate synthase [Rhodococcus sp. T7]